jgi:hypothetical protein
MVQRYLHLLRGWSGCPLLIDGSGGLRKGRWIGGVGLMDYGSELRMLSLVKDVEEKD